MNIAGGPQAAGYCFCSPHRRHIPRGRLTQGGIFNNVLAWGVAANLPSDQLSLVITHLNAIIPDAPPFPKINVNTAPRQVLLCLPAFTDQDADAIIAHRLNNPNPDNPADISWLLDILPKNTLIVAGGSITGSSACFSADILAASPRGRAFNRTRIVIDASSGHAKIIYRRDLTPSGWPLDPAIRTALRDGTLSTNP